MDKIELLCIYKTVSGIYIDMSVKRQRTAEECSKKVVAAELYPHEPDLSKIVQHEESEGEDQEVKSITARITKREMDHSMKVVIMDAVDNRVINDRAIVSMCGTFDWASMDPGAIEEIMTKLRLRRFNAYCRVNRDNKLNHKFSDRMESFIGIVIEAGEDHTLDSYDSDDDVPQSKLFKGVIIEVQGN